jgi:aspartyl-tRNA(Asn)/glutamyl-tRNA(Gln) amidotransferase subunit A
LLPVGLQIMAPALRDDICYRIGATFEAAYTAQNGAVLAQARPLGSSLREEEMK